MVSPQTGSICYELNIVIYMIRDLIDELPEDPWRGAHQFSPGVQACHGVLFRSGASRAEMEKAINDWLAAEQPCRFGQMEAKQGRLAFCLLTENDLYRGDDHIRARIEEDRVAWKRRALDGDSHGFIIVAVSPQIARATVGPEFRRLACHLCGLYLGRDDQDVSFHDSLLLAIQNGGEPERREWKVGVNFFAAQGDGKWWRDHRFPGGIAYSMNSVGHMARCRAEEMIRRDATLAAELAEVPRDRLVYWALPMAMRTIGIRQPESTRGTWLIERGQCVEDREPPTYEVRERVFRELVGYSENRYHGSYHTDETIPSPYFDTAITTPEESRRRDDLFFTYLHDARRDDAYLTMGVGTLAQAIEEDEAARNTERANDT
jgi:hypothetical protein